MLTATSPSPPGHNVLEERPQPTESRYRERLPNWLVVLITTILAIAIIWIMLIAIYPSIAL